MLGRFIPLCERLYVFDNSRPATEGDPLLIAYKDQAGAMILLEPGLIPVIDDVLRPLT